MIPETRSYIFEMTLSLPSTSCLLKLPIDEVIKEKDCENTSRNKCIYKKIHRRSLPVASTDDRTKTDKRITILSNCIFVKPKACILACFWTLFDFLAYASKLHHFA